MSKLPMLKQAGSENHLAFSAGSSMSTVLGGEFSEIMKLKSATTPVSTHRWVNCQMNWSVSSFLVSNVSSKGTTRAFRWAARSSALSLLLNVLVLKGSRSIVT